MLKENPNLTFYPEEHIYRIDGHRVESVTQVVHKLVPEFRAEEHAARVAEREGLETDDILLAWETIATKAAEDGTHVHEFAEIVAGHVNNHHDLTFQYVLQHEELEGYMNSVLGWYANRPLGDLKALHQAEFRACSKRLLIAGTVDLITSLGGDEAIVDFKTSREIELQRYGNLLEPFEWMPDGQFCIYTLQLNIYRLMLKEHGYDAKRLAIVHVGPLGHWRQIEVPIIEEPVLDYLEDRVRKRITRQ